MTGDGSTAAKGPIVVGVDGSESSERALAWAVAEARVRDLPVEAVIAWDFPTNYGYVPPLPEGLDFGAAAAEALDACIASALSADDARIVTKRVVEGHPRQILREESGRASMIVVGNRGHGGVAGLLLGSVSEFLAAHARCPVVIVRATDG